MRNCGDKTKEKPTGMPGISSRSRSRTRGDGLGLGLGVTVSPDIAARWFTGAAAGGERRERGPSHRRRAGSEVDHTAVVLQTELLIEVAVFEYLRLDQQRQCFGRNDEAEGATEAARAVRAVVHFRGLCRDSAAVLPPEDLLAASERRGRHPDA